MDTKKPLDEATSDQAFADLFGHAAPRPAPPAADEALVREAVHREWQAVARSRVRRRRLASLALAASVLIGVFFTLNAPWSPEGDFRQQRMASVQKHLGEVLVNGRSLSATGLESIRGGDGIETAAGAGLALAWHGGGSLRLDESTRISFESANRIYLRQGRVYFDSTAGLAGAGMNRDGAIDLEIRTDHGVVRHLGTQYMTQIADEQLVVSVREGVVSIAGKARAVPGQRFTLSAGGVLSSSDTNGVDGWEWIEKSSPAVSLDGRSVHAALEWVSRESGRRIRYASAAAEELARQETLHGRFDMEPSRALRVFMLTVDLDARMEGEVIVVSVD